jgi:hypothetical protein
LRGKLDESQANCDRLEEENGLLRERVSQLEVSLAEPQPVCLPLGDPPAEQHYPAGMIVLSVNLMRQLGIRSTEAALKIF